MPIHPLSQGRMKSKSEFPPPSVTNFPLSWHSVDLEGKSWVTGSHWSSNKPDGISICDRPGGFEAVHLLLRIKLKVNWQSCQMGSTELLQQVMKLLGGRRLLWISQSGVCVCSDESEFRFREQEDAEWQCLAIVWEALSSRVRPCPEIKVSHLSSSCRTTWNVPALELNDLFTSSGTMVMFCQQSSAWCWIFVHLWLRDFFPYKANHWDCHFRDSVPYKANHFRDCVINKTSSMSCFSNKNALQFSVPCTHQRLSCCTAVPGLLLANQKTWGV